METDREMPKNDQKSKAYLEIMKELQEKDEEYLDSLTPQERAKVNEQ